MGLREYTTSHTYREHKTWVAWLELKHNPDLTHYYLAQLACEVRRVLSTKPNDIQIKDFYLNLVHAHSSTGPTEAELKAKTELSKSAWVGAVGGLDKVEHRTAPQDDQEYEDTSCPLPESLND